MPQTNMTIAFEMLISFYGQMGFLPGPHYHQPLGPLNILHVQVKGYQLVINQNF